MFKFGSKSSETLKIRDDVPEHVHPNYKFYKEMKFPALFPKILKKDKKLMEKFQKKNKL